MLSHYLSVAMVLLSSKPPQASPGIPQLCPCGKFHDPLDMGHTEFYASMPQDPTDLTDDLLKMGLYRPEVIQTAQRITRTEMMQSLLLKQVARDPEEEQIYVEMIRQAGGLDQVMGAAFGPQASEFFADTLRAGPFARRRFLKQMLVAATLMGATGIQGQRELQAQESGGALEKTDMRIGFIPITCATPIIMSQPLGFYERYGLNVEVVKLPNWAAVRDSAIAGELDAYHMLMPMTLSISLGLGSTAFPMRLASIENINGQAITVANKHKDSLTGPADFDGFTIGVPFPFSMHNFLLRYYLATGGLNPDTDVQITPVPPPDSVARLTVGDIDAMLMPDPFNQRAVAEGAGFLHMVSKELWAGHPCCAFAASQDWIDEHPNTFNAVNKAIIDGAAYSSDAANRAEIAEAIAPPNFLNQPVEVIRAVLTGSFEDGLGNTQEVPDRIDFDPYPWHSFAYWITNQMVRWDFITEDQADYEGIAGEIFLTDIARSLAEDLGQNPPDSPLRVEELKFDTFDPADPQGYLQAQIDAFGV